MTTKDKRTLIQKVFSEIPTDDIGRIEKTLRWFVDQDIKTHGYVTEETKEVYRTHGIEISKKILAIGNEKK